MRNERFAMTGVLSFIFMLTLPVWVDAAKPPLFELKDTDGNRYSLDSDLGKNVIILDFWATWCKPCLRELPHINEIYKKNKDKGLKVYAIAIDDPSTSSQIKPTVMRYKLDMTILLDTDSSVIRKYNPSRNVPYLVLIGPDGEVVREFTGYKPGDEKLVEELVDELIASKQETAEPVESADKGE